MNNNQVNLNKLIGVNPNSFNNAQTQVNPKKEPPTEETLEKMDTLELGNKGQETFGTYKIDRQKLNQLKLDFMKNTDSFKEMVRSMIEKQGYKVNEVLKAIEDGETPLIEIDGETRAKAQEAISENGYWGVSQTSSRLLEFAKTVSGGDPSKIETLRSAFKEGFEQAKEAFGGELPEISQQTYDKVMEGFDAWEKGESI